MNITAQLFKALSDPTRLRIINLLAEGEICVCELMEILSLPQSTVSRHLAYLRKTELVIGRRDGVWIYYRLDTMKTNLQQTFIPILQRYLCEIPQADEDRKQLKQLQSYCERHTGR